MKIIKIILNGITSNEQSNLNNNSFLHGSLIVFILYKHILYFLFYFVQKLDFIFTTYA